MSSKVLATSADGDGVPAVGTEGPAVDEALIHALGALAGLDAARGLKHLRGRVDSYVRLLRRFAETRPADIEIMQASLATRDYTELSAVVHNIKGIAGFLGASSIQTLATEVSAAVRAGRDAAEIGRFAEVLIEAQAELCAGVLALIDQPSGPDE